MESKSLQNFLKEADLISQLLEFIQDLLQQHQKEEEITLHLIQIEENIDQEADQDLDPDLIEILIEIEIEIILGLDQDLDPKEQSKR